MHGDGPWSSDNDDVSARRNAPHDSHGALERLGHMFAHPFKVWLGKQRPRSYETVRSTGTMVIARVYPPNTVTGASIHEEETTWWPKEIWDLVGISGLGSAALF